MTSDQFEENLKELIASCLKDITPGFFLSESVPEIELEIPKDRSHGDIATNIALRLSKRAKKPPMEYAASLADSVNIGLKSCAVGNEIDRAEARQPGFVNFWFSENRLFETIESILKQKERYGDSDMGKGQKVNIEFVSANPTGPLTVAHGRQAAFGDTLANILKHTGYRVTREYYLNDEGNQIDLLAESIRARYMESFGVDAGFPDNGYKGQYITDIAESIKAKYSDKLIKKGPPAFFADFGCKWMVDDIKRDLADFNVSFDVWYSQKNLNKSGKIEKALKVLSRKNMICEKDGASWFMSSRLGDDKDRVVVKSSGEYTYLAPDIAYHMYKFRRGFKRLIDILGPDHHGYIPRIKAAVKAMGHEENALEALIVQLCTLYKDGKAVQMSTRAGEYATLKDLISEVGKDAARFFFLMRKRDSHLDFDLDLAKKHSMDNPVYYIQYAHARICSAFKFRTRKKSRRGISLNRKYLKEEAEFRVMKLLGGFRPVVRLCARKLEVFPLVSYLTDVASAFHSYYDKHRIVTEDAGLTEARLFLCSAVRIVLANGLGLLGITSPDSM